MSQPTNCPFCQSEPSETRYVWKCGSYQFPDSLPLSQTTLCIEREARQKAEAALADLEATTCNAEHLRQEREARQKAEAELALYKRAKPTRKYLSELESQNQKLRALLVRAIDRLNGWEVSRPTADKIRKELEAL